MAKYKFGDIVREVKAKINRDNNPYDYYVAGDHMDTEDLTIRRRGRFATDDVGPAFIREFRKGQILYGSRRTYLKKVAVADFDGVTSNVTFVLETKDPSILLQELLPFIMLSEGFTQWSIMKSKGSTNPYVLFSDLANYEVDLPPIEKQKELAALLWSMVKVKDAYNKVLKATDNLVKSQFIALFGDWKSNTNGFPIMKLGKIADVGSSKRVFVSELQTTGIPFYRGTEIGALATGEEIIPDLYIAEEHYESLKKATGVPSIGDLLMPSICPDGRIWQVTSTKPFYFKDGRVLWIHLKNDTLNSTYLQHLLKQIFTTDYESIASGTTFIELKIFSLKDLAIMVPNIDLQKRFELLVQQSDKSKFEIEQALAELTATYKRIIAENLG